MQTLNDDEQLSKLALEVDSLIANCLDKGFDPFIIAAIFVKSGLQIYRTKLSQEDYYFMIDAISLRRDEVKPYSETLVH